MDLFFKKENIDLNNFYPTDLLSQWSFINNEIKDNVDSNSSIITFGSFPIGDFLWLKNKEKLVYVSDFEFTILFNDNYSLRKLSTINNIVDNFNIKQHNKHWGFNCNVVFEHWDVFLKRISEDVFFRNELIKSCSIIHSKQKLPDPFKNISAGTLSNKQLIKILKSICYNLLIVLDERFTPNKSNFDKYCGAVISKSILKLGKLWYNYKEIKIDNYYNLINNKIISSSDPIIKECLNKQYHRLFVDRKFFKADLLLYECHDNIIHNITNNIKIQNSIVSFTRKYLYMISNNSIKQNLNKKRIKIVKNYLRDKGQHYNYYRNIYL